MRRVFASLFALAFLGLTASALADVPTEMSVQGRLTNAGGSPVPAGVKSFTFKIFDAPVGGIEIWPGGPGETQALSTDANGLWNAGVGTVIPLTEAVFLSPVRWLEVTVDDGANPIETLPRIELRTNPYTYRAATSQQADSLAGNSLGDIADMFVDEAADTMSGQLRIDWDHTGGVSTLEVENINNGYLSTWSDFTGTWGMSVDANSDNGAFNLAVGGECLGDNTSNYGVYGVARGFGSTNFAVFGNAGDGVNNFAGYFQGDVLVQNFNGDAGVSLPNDAISAAEILDEPGIASNSSTSEIAIGSASMSDVLTVTITIPAAGYIKLDAQGNLIYTGTTGTNQGWYQIDETAGGGYDGFFSGGGEDGYVTAGGGQYALYLTRTYYKASPGSYTFRLEGQSWVFNAGGAYTACRNPVLTATYFPQSYGSVVTVATAGDASSFESSTASTITQPAGDGSAPGETVYLVDLRELELKVAKAEAEAERARRELVEAKLSSSSGPVGTVRNAEEERKQ